MSDAVVGMTVRLAEAVDAAAMADVELGTALTAYADFFPADAPVPDLDLFVRRWGQRLAAAASGRTAVLCAVDHAGRIVGTVCGSPDPEDPDRGYLASLYVRPALWGRGIGRALHDEVVAHFHHVRFAAATLWVIEENLRSRSMYERWGWQLTPGRREAFPGTGVKEVRYVRPVTATSQPGVA